MHWVFTGLSIAMLMLWITTSSAVKLNNDHTLQSANNSGNPNIRDGKLYNWPYVVDATAVIPTNKVSIASIKSEETIKIPEPKTQVKSFNPNCSCVTGLNAHFGTNFKTLDNFARSIPINSKIPADIGYVITYESRPGGQTGHIAHYYLLGNEIVIDWEANYERCKVSSGRRLTVGSPLIKGYIN